MNDSLIWVFLVIVVVFLLIYFVIMVDLVVLIVNIINVVGDDGLKVKFYIYFWGIVLVFVVGVLFVIGGLGVI